MNNKYQIKYKFPTNLEYNRLFKSVGWDFRTDDKINAIRENSIFTVCVYLKNKIVGMARVVGDGCYFTVYDVVVRTEYQNNGIGAILLNEIISWYKSFEDDDTYLYLGASKNREKFYEQFGFIARPYGDVGAGMKYDPDYKKLN